MDINIAPFRLLRPFVWCAVAILSNGTGIRLGANGGRFELPIHGDWYDHVTDPCVSADAIDSFDDPAVVLLCRSILAKDFEACESLVRSGVDLNAVGLGGITPLMISYLCYEESVFELLLTSGANPNIPVTDQAPLRRYLLGGRTVSYFLATGDHTRLFEIALAHGANPNTTTMSGVPILHNMVGGGAPDSADRLKLVLRYGADVNVLNNRGATPVIAAVDTYPRFDLASILIDYGADIRLSPTRESWKLVHYVLNATNRGAPLTPEQERDRQVLLRKLAGMGENLEYAEYELYMATIDSGFLNLWPPQVAQALGLPVPERFLNIPVPDEIAVQYRGHSLPERRFEKDRIRFRSPSELQSFLP